MDNLYFYETEGETLERLLGQLAELSEELDHLKPSSQYGDPDEIIRDMYMNAPDDDDFAILNKFIQLAEKYTDKHNKKIIAKKTITSRKWRALVKSFDDILECIPSESDNISSHGIEVFQQMEKLFATEVSICLLIKDERSQPHSIEIQARKVKRTCAINTLKLTKKTTGLLNREGAMLYALATGGLAENIKSYPQAMTGLRKIIKNIGITDSSPFYSKKDGWKPKFKLTTSTIRADKREQEREKFSLNNEPEENDAAEKFLQKHDK